MRSVRIRIKGRGRLRERIKPITKFSVNCKGWKTNEKEVYILGVKNELKQCSCCGALTNSKNNKCEYCLIN